MARNNKKKSYPISADPTSGPVVVKYPKNLKVNRVPKPTDVGPGRSLAPVTYALQKDVDVLDDAYVDLNAKIKELETSINNKLVNKWEYVNEVEARLEKLNFKFYVFVGLTTGIFIVSNLYNWLV